MQNFQDFNELHKYLHNIVADGLIKALIFPFPITENSRRCCLDDI